MCASVEPRNPCAVPVKSVGFPELHVSLLKGLIVLERETLNTNSGEREICPLILFSIYWSCLGSESS